MSNLVKAIIETYTHTTELYIRNNNLDRFAKADGWQHVDTLRFHAERKLKREIQDLEFWISRQQQREADAKLWAQRYKAQFNGDEISTTNFQSSVAKYKAEAFGLRVMQDELAAARAAIKELTGADYTSIEAEMTDAEVPDDIKQLMADMDALEAANDEKPAKKTKRAG